MMPARTPADGAIYDVLSLIDDPCMCLAGKGLSILDMGIVNHAMVENAVAYVSLTFTDPTCLFEFRISNEIIERVGALPGMRDVQIAIEHLPIWTNDRLSRKAQRHFEEERAEFLVRMSRIGKGPAHA